MWGTARSVELDLVVWSLVHEMRISLAFPFLLLTIQRARSASLILFAGMSVACALTLHTITGRIPYGFFEVTLPQTFAVTGYFAVFFAAGAWLAIDHARIKTRLERLAPAIRRALVPLACLILLKGDRGAEDLATMLIDWVHGVAALIIIAVIASNAPACGLTRPGLQWLGRISYSLYLVHLPIIYVMYELFPDLHSLLSSAVIVVLSLATADILARVVEFPFIALSRRLPKRPLPGVLPTG
jgi:peptidoglycan/LPS O-acetylase OafA/YrhL